MEGRHLQKVFFILDESIKNIKDQINNAEKLKEEAKDLLSEREKKISNSKSEIKLMINKANEDSEKLIIKTNEEIPSSGRGGARLRRRQGY